MLVEAVAGEVRDRSVVHRRRDGTGRPASVGHPDQHGRPSEAGQDDKHPEDPRQLVRGGDVGQAVDGGGLEELLDNLHGDRSPVTGHTRHVMSWCLLLSGDYHCLLYFILNITHSICNM